MYYFLLAIMGRYEESLEQAKKGSELAPELGARGWGAGLAVAMLRIGLIEEGITRLEKIVEEDPGYAAAHDTLGRAYYKASKIDQAMSEFRKAVALSKGDPYFKGDLAKYLALTGNTREAESILNELKEVSARAYVSDVDIEPISIPPS
jgi:tetratricopeptide (TPR) repeat protein